MNDLSAFDLNQLQMPNNRWEMLIPTSESGGPQGKVPPARTNHTVVTYNDKLYLWVASLPLRASLLHAKTFQVRRYKRISVV